MFHAHALFNFGSQGGGINAHEAGTANLRQCQIFKNKAEYGAGILIWEFGTKVDLDRCDVYENMAGMNVRASPLIIPLRTSTGLAFWISGWRTSHCTVLPSRELHALQLLQEHRVGGRGAIRSKWWQPLLHR